MDKNYGQIFIFWDKWFGTFQEELKDVPPVYGVTRPVRTWNPIKINFLHLWLLFKDAWLTKSWKDKFRVWFMPTGWRPADVAATAPVFKIDNVYDFEKYDTVYSKSFLAWTWFQTVLLLLFVSYLFGNIASIGIPGIYIYGTFIFLFVYAFSELMDRNRYAVVWEILKAAAGIGIIYYTGDWFGISTIQPVIKYVLSVYFIVSAGISFWFGYYDTNSQKVALV
jgi:hypothetical protein